MSLPVQKIVPSITTVDMEFLRRSLEVSQTSPLVTTSLQLLEHDLIDECADRISSRIIKYTVPSLTEIKMSVTCLDAVHSKIIDYTVLYRYHEQSSSYITQKFSCKPSRDISKDVASRINVYSDQFAAANGNHVKTCLLVDIIDRHDDFMSRYELVMGHIRP